MLANWEKLLIRQLDMQALQYQYAWLYGELVTEWLSSDKEKEADLGTYQTKGLLRLRLPK